MKLYVVFKDKKGRILRRTPIQRPNGLGKNQRKIRKRLRHVPQLRNSKKYSR